MGNVRESLATLKVYNLVQATVAATVSWQLSVVSGASQLQQLAFVI